MAYQKRRFPSGWNMRGNYIADKVCTVCGCKELNTKPHTHVKDGVCAQCEREARERLHNEEW